MNILLAFCLLLVMISLVMALNAVTRLERLRQHNELMQKELDQLRLDYTQMQERVLAAQAAAPASSPAAPEPESRQEPAEPATPLAPEELLQEQLRQLQAVVEAYRRQHAGRIPASLESLGTFANRQGLQRQIENPYTRARNPLVSEDVCLDITHEPTDEGLPEYAGRLLYQANFGARAQITGYTLAAFDGRGLLLKRPDGEVLTLSHTG